MNERNRCVHVDNLFNTSESTKDRFENVALLIFCLELSPFEYHRLCNDNINLLCFMDDSYLCICDQNHTRVDCFDYDYSLDQCSRCLTGGRCIKGDLSTTTINEFVCICVRCDHGRLCQFSSRELSFTLDSLIGQESRGVQSTIYLAFATLIFVIGGLTNYASFITFKRSTPRKFGVGNYLLIVSILNQCSLISLLLKVMLIFFSPLMSNLSCKFISYILSVTTRYTFWITSWITTDRVLIVLFPFGTYLKIPRFAYLTSVITFLVVSAMHVHELIFYRTINDPSGKVECIANFPLYLSTYKYVNIMAHHLIPFCIQVLSVTLLIVFTARSRSRTSSGRLTFIETLRRQFHSQKELYLTPLIIVLTGLPQIIISSSFSCQELSTWQKHLLCITYFLSYAPQLLGFVLFVMPSTSYLSEFRQTKFSKALLTTLTLKQNKK